MPTYETLVREYHALVFHVARGVLKDAAAAEDAAQDVFLSFLQNPAALGRATNVKAFVCRSALNRALDLAKAGKRRERRESLVAERSAAMDPVEAAFRSELRTKVGELPEEQRQAVDLHYFRGLTLPETAEAMAIPVGTVSSRIHTALGKLRTALGAAAFVALLARLETELSACEVGDAVPAALRERLLGLRTGPGSVVSGAAGKGGARVAMVTLAALVVATGLIAWRARAGEDDGGTATGGGGMAAAEPGVRGANEAAKEDESAAAKEKPVEPVPVALAANETVLEGFLFRTADGLRVLPVGAWDHQPKQTMWDEESWKEATRREAMVMANEDALAGVPAATSGNFGAFLNGDCGPEGAPLARVRLRVRDDNPAAPPEATKIVVEGIEVPVPSRRKAAAPHPVTVVEVMEREVLTAAWLEAWRDLVNASGKFAECWALDPGLDKRAKVLDAATRIGEARERARGARAGAKASWRIAREWECTWSVSARMRAVGLGDVVVGCPDAEDLRAVLQESKTRETLRSNVLSRWGEEALALETWYYRDNGNGFEWTETTLGTVCAMGDVEYADFRKRLEAGESAWVETRDAGRNTVEQKRLLAVVAEFGMTLDDLSSLDRERFLLDHGVRVVSVEPGSAAEKAGIQPGDVIWRATVPIQSKQDVIDAACPIWSPAQFGTLIENGRKHGADTIPLDVVRESGPLKLTLSL